jgi:hypothetical protein
MDLGETENVSSEIERKARKENGSIIIGQEEVRTREALTHGEDAEAEALHEDTIRGDTIEEGIKIKISTGNLLLSLSPLQRNNYRRCLRLLMLLVCTIIIIHLLR